MKWRCPTCSAIWSIPDVDLGKWEKKTRCRFCPPVKKIVKTIEIEPLKDLETLETVTSQQSTVSSQQSTVSSDEDHLDDFDDNIVQVKAHVTESDKISDVTDDVKKKRFREQGYEGKKSGRKKRKS